MLCQFFFARTSFLDKNAVLSYGKIAICKQHGHFCRIFNCLGAFDIAFFDMNSAC